MTFCGIHNFYQPFFYSGCNPFVFQTQPMFNYIMPQWNFFSNNIFGFNSAFLPQRNKIFMESITRQINNYKAQNNYLQAPYSSEQTPTRTFDSNNFFNLTPTKAHTYNTNLPRFDKSSYNKKKAQKLANEIKKISSEGGFDNLCAKHVKDSIQNAGLGNYEKGHAYQMNNILKNNKNFREISTKGLDLSKLPAGCILVYDRGVSNYSSEYGHTEITLGNGTAASGGITHNIRAGARVYIPV